MGRVMRLDENLAYEEAYERGAVLLTALAYPQQSDQRGAFNSICRCAAGPFG